MLTEIELKTLIKESIKEAIREERLALMEVLVPYVSHKEMEEIIQEHGLPEDYEEEEFLDMTHWVMSGD